VRNSLLKSVEMKTPEEKWSLRQLFSSEVLESYGRGCVEFELLRLLLPEDGSISCSCYVVYAIGKYVELGRVTTFNWEGFRERKMEQEKAYSKQAGEGWEEHFGKLVKKYGLSCDLVGYLKGKRIESTFHIGLPPLPTSYTRGAFYPAYEWAAWW
jgi:hypothetical protein